MGGVLDTLRRLKTMRQKYYYNPLIRKKASVDGSLTFYELDIMKGKKVTSTRYANDWKSLLESAREEVSQLNL